MGVLATIVRWIAHLWVIVAAGVILLSCAGTLIGAESLWAGVTKLWEIWSPFNLWNAFACLVLIAPAIGLYTLSDWFEKRDE